MLSLFRPKLILPRKPSFRPMRAGGWLPLPGLPIMGVTGDVTLFSGGEIRLLGGVPWLDSGDPVEDCCCPPFTYDCETVCLTGPPRQVKVTIPATYPVTVGVPCDDGASCPAGDYFLDFEDGGALSSCTYFLCIDDPCDAGKKIHLTFAYLTGVISGGLSWNFQMFSNCTTCVVGSTCTVWNQQRVDQDISDVSDHIDPGADFDCNGIGPTQADQTLATSNNSGGLPSVPYCYWSDVVTVTPIP